MAIAPDGRATSPDRHLMVSSRLRDRRRVLGLTQKQVVTRLASLGLSSTNKSLSSLEHGAGIDVGKLPELAAALECTVTYLLGLTDDPASWQPDGSASWGTRPPATRAAGSGRQARPARVPAGSVPAVPRPDPGTDAAPAVERAGRILGPYPTERARRRGAARSSD